MICDMCGYCADCMEHNRDCQCYTPASASRLGQERIYELDDYAADDAWAGARLALDAARDADSGAIPYGEARRRIDEAAGVD